MTSLKQIEANRRNAQKSTGPATLEGKHRSRCNALRHGLSAETVVGILERAEDYVAFEGVIMAQYDAGSVIERELVARLASLLWRLRRATAIETSLFELQADPLAGFRQSLKSSAHLMPVDPKGSAESESRIPSTAVSGGATSATEYLDMTNAGRTEHNSQNLAECFLRLANLPNFAFDRLSRYEASLWRQADQIIVLLNNLRQSRK